MDVRLIYFVAYTLFEYGDISGGGCSKFNPSPQAVLVSVFLMCVHVKTLETKTNIAYSSGEMCKFVYIFFKLTNKQLLKDLQTLRAWANRRLNNLAPGIYVFNSILSRWKYCPQTWRGQKKPPKPILNKRALQANLIEYKALKLNSWFFGRNYYMNSRIRRIQ